MKSKLLLALGLTLCAFFSPPAQAAESGVDRTVLPPPDPQFNGKINVALKDSKADWPQVVGGSGGCTQRPADHGR